MFSNPKNDISITPWELTTDNLNLILKTANDILKNYQDLFIEIFGEDLNLDPSTPQGQIMTGLVESDMNTLNLIQDFANAIMFGGSGEYLDKWAFNFYRVVRKQGTPSSVNMTIYGNPRTNISAGFTVSDGNLNYILQNDIEIPSNGQIQVTFVCTEITDQSSLANTVNQIVTPTIGVNRVDNLSPSLEGSPIESDSSLFKRCLNYGSLSANATLDSLLAEIAELDGVLKVNGYENYTSSQKLFRGINFEPHSFGLVILGGDNTDIAQTIQRLKPPGPTMMGTTQVEIPVNNLQGYNKAYNVTYSFYRPTNVPLKFSVSIKLLNYTPANYQDLIKNAIFEFINNFQIGGTLNINDCINYIFDYCGENVFVISQLQIGKKSGGLSTSDISLNFTEMATIELTDISVSGS